MLPVIILSISGILQLFLGFNKGSRTYLYLTASAFVLLAALGGMYEVMNPDFAAQLSAYTPGMMNFDKTAMSFTFIILFTTLFIFPMGEYFDRNVVAQPAEYTAIMLFSLVGAVLMVSFKSLIMMFVGLEILSVSMYILAGADKRNPRSIEASMKYLLMGAFATGVLLFGFAMIYGVTGKFDLQGITEMLVKTPNGLNNIMFVLGMGLVLIGMLFKVSIVPFHWWTPDVYDGAPSMFTAFMSTVVKIAGFAALYLLLSSIFAGYFWFWSPPFQVLVVLTLLLSNLSATNQTSFKRMLAYSSISHAGYLLMALETASGISRATVLFYTLSYSLATVSAFAILQAISVERKSEDFTAFNGLSKSNPFLAGALTVAMLSMAGIPLTAGFIGKLLVFTTALANDHYMVVGAGILMSAVGLYYYMKVVIAMYMRPELVSAEPVVISFNYRMVLVLTTAFTLLLGLMPELVLNLNNF